MRMKEIEKAVKKLRIELQFDKKDIETKVKILNIIRKD